MRKTPPDTPLVTVSGRVASGTSTVAEVFSDAGFEVVSGGDIFRQQAEENGYSLAEYTELADSDDSIDRELDERLQEIAAAHLDGDREPDGCGLVLESRLSGFLCNERYTNAVWVAADKLVRMGRVAEREDEAEHEAIARDASERDRYREWYGIDIGDIDSTDFDLVVNSGELSEAQMIRVVRSYATSLRGDVVLTSE